MQTEVSLLVVVEVSVFVAIAPAMNERTMMKESVVLSVSVPTFCVTASMDSFVVARPMAHVCVTSVYATQDGLDMTACVSRARRTASTRKVEWSVQVMELVSATSANVMSLKMEGTVAGIVRIALPAKGIVPPTKSVCSARCSGQGNIQMSSA